MKIRHTITLWITGAGVVAGLLFSIVIAFEMIEQPYELLDAELDSLAHTMLTGLAPGIDQTEPQTSRAMLDAMGRLYWFKVFDNQKHPIYSSAMTDLVALPLTTPVEKGYNVTTSIPAQAAALEQEDGDKVTFRVRVFTLPFADREYLVQIARPMEKLQEEIIDLILSIAVGLVIFTISLLLLAYFAAGKIVQPISKINTLVREINDKTLDKRIPLRTNKDELYILSASLNQMFDRLQFSFQRQKEFIANASHELKTPIALQRLFFDEALQRNDLPKQFHAQLIGQAGGLLRMDRLLKSLLDLSALELGETCAAEPVDLAHLLASVLTEFEDIFLAADIQVEHVIEQSVQLQGDKEKIRRMLINLIDNAVKYNNTKHGKIRFALHRDQGTVHLEISNTGPGIPASDLKRVFNQFYRVEKSRSTALGGSGLGLTIVQRIVELHHGTVEITSEPDDWTSVQLQLPTSLPAAVS